MREEKRGGRKKRWSDEGGRRGKKGEKGGEREGEKMRLYHMLPGMM